ncbi:hypothetical protein SAMN04489727_7531 [Amycolatopsis tolypomycina]|uniref:Uncharacterized protein n=1 Tax=Amycolatopsis tolypomycina TaxID=208445 RepID=A0A1H4ZZW2_9PSEU|nr:hypothetical protein SAMN04489727_7531 [Amycolatopsis tolypomycina]
MNDRAAGANPRRTEPGAVALATDGLESYLGVRWHER